MFDRLLPAPLVVGALQHLQREGVQRGAIVAWLGHNSWDMVATLVACQRLGAVLLSLNGRLAPVATVLGVAECAVVGLPDARWGEVPALVLVLRPGAALQALFDARLARFKHPRRARVVDALPKTALGKLQRAALARSLV